MDHSPQAQMVFVPGTVPYGGGGVGQQGGGGGRYSETRHRDGDGGDGRHGSGKRSGGRWAQQPQQQISVKDLPINQIKNHSITAQEPPWTDVTTVMMRNLPNKYSQQLLMEELASHGFHLQTDFDFFYLPMDHSSAVNLGYCFINFVDTPIANAFAATFSGKRMRRFNSSKTVVVMPASIQGYERNYIYYCSTKVAQAQDPQYRPIFCHTPVAQPAAASVQPAVMVAQAPAAHIMSTNPGVDMSGAVWGEWGAAEYWTQQAEASQQWVLPPQAAIEGDEDQHQWLSQGTMCSGYAPGGGLVSTDPFPPTATVAADARGGGLVSTDPYPPMATVLMPPPTLVGPPLPPTDTIQEGRVSRTNTLRVRNTFLDAPVERSPSVERFMEERQVKSCPASAPRSQAGSARIPDLPMHDHGSAHRLHQALDAADHIARGWASHVVTAAKCLEQEELSEPTGGETASSAGTSSRTGSSNGASPGMLPGAPKMTGFSDPGSAEIMFHDALAEDARRRLMPAETLPSKGSSLHAWGICKPCAFHCAHTEVAKGCKNGAECQFCHLCEPGEKKRRKKERQVAKREGREWMVGRTMV